MLTFLPMLVGLASPPPYCPPETGQLRWDELRHEFKVERTYAARGTLWDRDQSGAPSKGDIFRVDAAWIEGSPLAFEETWIVLGDGLAQDIAASFAAAKDTKASCESILAINEKPPVMATGALLARHLNQAARPALQEQEDVARMQLDLGKLAQEICKKTKYIAAADLTELLIQKVAKPYGALGETRVRGAAEAAARDRSVTCTRLSAGNISFD